MHNAQFSLHSRLFKKHTAPVDLREWVLGNDQFFINCARRSGRIDGFLATKRVTQRGAAQAEYTSACVPSIKYHNEVDAFTLFSLISPRVKESLLSPAKIVTPEQDLNEEFDSFIGDSSLTKFSLKDKPLPGKRGASLGMEMTHLAPQDQ